MTTRALAEPEPRLSPSRPAATTVTVTRTERRP